MKYTVDRKTWYRGQPTGSRLYIGTGEFAGHMCCLGHISLQAGCTPVQLLNRSTPAVVARDGGVVEDWLVQPRYDDQASNSWVALAMMAVNDVRAGRVAGGIDGIDLPNEQFTQFMRQFPTTQHEHRPAQPVQCGRLIIRDEQHREEVLSFLASLAGHELTFIN